MNKILNTLEICKYGIKNLEHITDLKKKTFIKKLISENLLNFTFLEGEPILSFLIYFQFAHAIIETCAKTRKRKIYAKMSVFS